MKNKKILVLSSITTYPVKSGGQIRSHYIVKELAKYNQVEVFVPIARRDDFPKFSTFQVNCGNYIETRNINFLLQGITFILERFGLFGLSFILFPFLLKNNSNLKKKLGEADVIVINFPHLGFLLENLNKDIYSISHNVEYELLSTNMKIKNSFFRNYFINKLYKAEKKLTEISKKSYVCTNQDRQLYSSKFGVDLDKIIVLENGVDRDKLANTENIPSSYNGKNNKVVFVGSYFKPNLEGIAIIEELANIYPDFTFYIIGSVAKGKSDHGNLYYKEIITQPELNAYLKYADFGINPIISGSGSNLKMIDYFMCGIPVITTKKGVRGFEEYTSMFLDETKLETFSLIVNEVNQSRQQYIERGNAIAKKYYWDDLVNNKIINGTSD